MNNQQFDSLTRTIGQLSSRRRLIKTIAITIWGGFLTTVWGSCNKDNKTTDNNNPDPEDKILVELLSNIQVQELLSTAQSDADYVFLRKMLDAGSYTTVRDTEGASVQINDKITSRSIVTQYKAPNINDAFYLVFGTDGVGKPIKYILRHEPGNQAIVGIYRDNNKVTRFEVNSTVVNNNPGGGVGASPDSSYNEACKICMETCRETNRQRQDSCIVRSVSSAVQVGINVRKAWKTIAGSAYSWADDLSEMIGQVNAINSSSSAIESCIKGEELNCEKNGEMCRDLCAGCNTSGGTTCSGLDKCVGGECRQVCNGELCGATEICKDGKCISLSDSCNPGQTYVGLYRNGPGLSRLTAGCCPIGGNNCGAMTNGMWGGCCPGNTICFPLGIGYGCCILAVSCD